MTLFQPAFALMALLFLCGCQSAKPAADNLARFEFEEPQMGVPFRIVLYATNQAAAERAADAAFGRIAQLNSMLSDYETDSEISRLSRSSEEGAPEVKVSEELWTILSASQKLARESGGAFDVTIGPCVGLWRKARREKELPDAQRLENARKKVGYRNLLLNEASHTARLVQPGMRLDAGAIAKGYAGDEALKAMRKLGVTRALVAASGDLTLGDAPPDQPGWRVKIEGYDAGGPPPQTITVANCAVATSGDLFQRLEIGGVRYSHILNPFTCVGMTNHALATVIARRGITADALATAMTILGPDRALRIAERYDAGVRIVRLEKNALAVYANRRFKGIPKAQAKP